MLPWIFAALAVSVAYEANAVIPPFLFGAVIAYLLNLPVSRLQRLMPRWLSVLAVCAAVTALVSYLTARELPVLLNQLTNLVDNREQILNSLIAQVSGITGWNPDAKTALNLIVERTKSFITDRPQDVLALGSYLSQSMLSVTICVISSIYLLAAADQVKLFFLRFVPEGRQREDMSEVFDEIDGKLTKYVIGETAVVGIMAVYSYAVMMFYGLKYALVLALLVGLGEVIPTLGPLVAIAVSTIIAISQLGFWPALGVPLWLGFGQTFQDYVVSPAIIGRSLHLWGLAMIFAVLVGDNWLGGLGMILAVPIAAAIKVVMDHAFPAISDNQPVAAGKDEASSRSSWLSLFRSLLHSLRRRREAEKEAQAG